MEKAGATVLENYRTYNIMGFIEVLFKLNHIYKKISLCKSHIIDYNPKVILLIDFPGFNLKIAKFIFEYLNVLEIIFSDLSLVFA